MADSVCPVADCSGHGACLAAGCECDSDFRGVACNIAIAALTSSPVVVVGVLVGAALLVVGALVAVQIDAMRCFSRKGWSRFGRGRSRDEEEEEEEAWLGLHEHPEDAAEAGDTHLKLRGGGRSSSPAAVSPQGDASSLTAQFPL